MGLNKKAIMFTFLSVMIATLFSFMFSGSKITPFNEQTQTTKMQIKTLNTFTKDFETYVERSLEISSYAAVQGMIEYMHIKKINGMEPYYDSVEEIQADFLECMNESTINSGSPCPFMKEKNFTNIINPVINLSYEEFNIDTSYQIWDFGMSQEKDPFGLNVWVNISYSIKHKYAEWNISKKIIESKISIIGLKDPLYLINGTYNNTFKKTNINRWNTTTTGEFLDSYSYRVFTGTSFGRNGFSFLERFINPIRTGYYISAAGNLRIESFIHPDNLSSSEQRIDTAYVDFIFWNNINKTGDCCVNGVKCDIFNINELDPDFVLDSNEHLTLEPFNLSLSDWTDNGLC
ncbi:MAG: hypothetical protein ABIC91_04695 [Nanoarchaeota archaeon]|nr:hypothetical protein [Nanoarchaeota archaeon]MBU1030673.1 hypothetical protein [Nanoarchaeota archaeon]MBU1849332.1 hypothetical protein [Nanoarchaeota archaeon]